MMKPHHSAIALLVAALGVASLPAQAQKAATSSTTVASSAGKAKFTETTKAQAVISALDGPSRVITLKAANGTFYDMIAGADVKNFDQLKVGDKVNVEYVRALSLELKKAGTATATPGTATGTATAAPGARPAVAVKDEVTVITDVIAVDPKAQLVTLRGPKGNTVALQVKDPQQLKLVKVGDKVEAVYTEALAVRVEAAN
jgi:Cu/Ag efflux protein CusF